VTWKGTAFCADREAEYSTSWQADTVVVERTDDTVTVELTTAERRAYFVLPKDTILIALDKAVQAGGKERGAPQLAQSFLE